MLYRTSYFKNSKTPSVALRQHYRLYIIIAMIIAMIIAQCQSSLINLCVLHREKRCANLAQKTVLNECLQF